MVTRKEKLAQSHESSTSLGFGQKKQACWATHQASIPVWLHGSCESQSIANSNLTKSLFTMQQHLTWSLLLQPQGQ
ncbi:hypothetical protein RHMOL_Rhmol11G0100100 [Rhododendron molle]|uniref:Uncharacterized protein n=1 Tax=Rhododendron molle TaxID=49168 RepID=A0ACC0LQP1_RHOML|nr:hypothetical protein RHMOL_Rhmol11G0100100 [Rhododendron molle]